MPRPETTSSYRDRLSRAIHWLVFRPWYPEELEPPVFTVAQRVYFALFALATCAGTVVLLGRETLPSVDMPLGVAAMAGVILFVAGFFAQLHSADPPVAISFEEGVLIALAVHYGADPALVGIAAGITFVTTLRTYFHGSWPGVTGLFSGLGNAGIATLQVLAISILAPWWLATVGDGPLSIAGLALVAFLLADVIDAAVTSIDCVCGGDPWYAAWEPFAGTELLFLRFNVPYLVLAIYAMGSEPWAIAAMIAPIVLVATATRSAQTLLVAEQALRTDALTGVHNRAHFWETLRQTMEGAAASQERFAVLVGDIDHFKQLNDSHGHVEGDRALVATAQSLASAVRSSDCLARYGGEEFAGVLPGVDVEAAREVAERMRQGARFALAPWGTSISIGVLVVEPGHGLTQEDVVARADALLYEAKRSGRNCVVAGATDGVADTRTNGDSSAVA